jgi:outer membrane autotransporter protein
MTPVAGKTLTPWLRTFADGGGMDLAHSGNVGTGGDFAFHQSDRGWELGLEARLSERLGLGVLFGGSEGQQRLRDDGGRDHFTGRTFGVFGTWQGASGAYVDLSQRWTGVDAHLQTAAGELDTEASASTLNLEAGLGGWHVGALRIAPELQYTRSRIGDIEAVNVGTSTFTAEGGTASRARLGVLFDRTFTAGAYELRPYGSLNVVREFDGEYAHAINGALLGTTDAGGTGAQVDLGLGARRGPLTFSGSVHWSDGGALENEFGAQFTARYSW